jgi:peroxiredoxin
MNRKVLIVVWVGVLAGQIARGDDRAKKPTPKTAGTDNDPLIQLELAPFAQEGAAEALLGVLNQLPWTSRTAVLPSYTGAVPKDSWHPKATAAVSIAERQWADLVDLVNRARKAGFTVSAVHLTRFGTVRIRTQFGPDKPSKEAQQRIETVFRKVPWLVDARFTAAGTKPDFTLAKSGEVRAEFVLGDSQVIEVGELLEALSKADMPPKAMRVARMFAGVPFGCPIPGDVELVDATETKVRTGKLQKNGRPLVLIFFPLTGKYKQGKVEKAYQAEPKHFARLKEVATKFADRADFVAISSSKADSFADVVALWRKAALPFPVYRDPEQRLATALSAGLANPPPHIFILDADRKLRYAGEFADAWVEPEQTKRVYLVEALERVLAKKFADNGAVWNRSAPCGCSNSGCHCPKCGCGAPCRCGCSTGAG